MDNVISGLVRKRAELAGDLARLEEALRNVDGTLRLLGYERPEAIEPHFTRCRPSLFKPGELMQLVCDAQREGLSLNPEIANWIIVRKDFDRNLYKRIRQAVQDCKKRIRKYERERMLRMRGSGPV